MMAFPLYFLFTFIIVATGRPIPRDEPQFHPDKLAATKPMNQNKKDGNMNDIDVIRIKNWSDQQKKDILLMYAGEWSLEALIQSNEFALFLPYELSMQIGIECDEDLNKMNKVMSYYGAMNIIQIVINGKKTSSVYALFGCKEGQIDTAMLFGIYDSFKLASMIIDAQSDNIHFNHMQTKGAEAIRYQKTEQRLIQRYGENGSGFWNWAEMHHEFGARKVQKIIYTKPDNEKTDL